MQYPNDLRRLRKQAGMTQADVANKLGITYQAYQNYESGKRMLKSTTIIKLRDILSATADEILGLSCSV